MKKFLIMASFGCILGLANVLSAANYGGGTGYADNPYQIYTAEQFNTIGSDIDDWKRCFILMNNIDMSGYTVSTFNSIGSGYGFSGNFDGQGFTIYNTPETIFEAMRLGTVSNLNLVHATSTYGGSLVGSMSGGTISNCHVQGNASGHTDVSLLAGYVMAGTISNCSTSGTVTGINNAQRLGGVIGSTETNASVTITNCSSSATIIADGSSVSLGGFIGEHRGGSIDNCYATGTATGNSCVGGFAGQIKAPVKNSYATGNITLQPYNSYKGNSGGGFAGNITPYSYPYQPIIDSCYSSGNITAYIDTYWIGGFAGCIIATVNDQFYACYSSGNINCGDYPREVGGLVGSFNYGTLNSCYSTSSVNGGYFSRNLGGLVGRLSDGKINNSYATGNINSGGDSRYLGGLAGIADGNSAIDKCFSIGHVSEGEYYGGLLGSLNGFSTATASFWDKEASGVTVSAAGKGKITADMQNYKTYSSAGWDFADTWSISSYPYLKIQPIVGHDPVFLVKMPANYKNDYTFNINCITGESLNWYIESEPCNWICNISPANGTFNGTEQIPLTITVASGGLTLGDYTCQLSVHVSNDTVVKIPLILSIVDPVDMTDMSQLAQYWGTIGCQAGENCKTADLYIDGKIDLKDFAILAANWLNDSLPVVRAEVSDSFESGNFLKENWIHDGDSPWTITNSEANDGSYSARTGTIGNSQTCSLTLLSDTTGYEVNTFSFACRYDTEAGYDFLKFYIDGVLVTGGSFSGYSGWSVKNFPLTPGSHEFTWIYSKDSDGSAGQDACWIDSIRIFKQ